MNSYASKNLESKSNSRAQTVSKQQRSGSPPSFQLIDNRLKAVTQRKLQTMARKSSKASQLRTVQEVAQQHSLQPKVPIQKKTNNTGLPDNLKAGIENLSGYSMDDVKVHYNSNKPTQLNAHAYAQGTDIHLGLGQEKHLPHEAWHVVQQKQGRVKPTMQMKGNVNVNDDVGLEKEADVMGKKSIEHDNPQPFSYKTNLPIDNTIQRAYAQQNYTGSHQQRTISIDNHNINWGGAIQSNRPNRGNNRAVLFETVSNSNDSASALLARIGARSADDGGNGIWDLGLTLALNSWYTPLINNTDAPNGQSRNLNEPVPDNNKLTNVQNTLDGQRTALLNNWIGPPVNIATIVWERRYSKNGNDDAELENARANVPFTSLRKLAARNSNAAQIQSDLESNRVGTVWRKMGDDDMPITAPNGNSREMKDLKKTEKNSDGITTFTTFGYNLTSVGQSPEMNLLLKIAYQGEMALRQKLVDLNVQTYPIEPNTYYKFSDSGAFDEAWDNVENMDVGGGGSQIKEGLRFKKSADKRYTQQKTFHNTMLDTDAGERNQDFINSLTPALTRAALGRDPELTVSNIMAILNQMDQSYFQAGVWHTSASQLMTEQELAEVHNDAVTLITKECKITATNIWFQCDQLAKYERIKRKI